MSFLQKGRSSYSRKLICAAYASAAVASLPGQSMRVQAAVFEQTCNGKIVVLGDGTPTGVSSQKRNPLVVEDDATSSSVIEFGGPVLATVSNVPTGEPTAADLPRPSSHCASSPVGTPSNGVLAMKAVHESLSLPAPRRLPQVFNDKQLQMRQLAARVGAQFANAPGVRKAKLDEPAFVKLFTTLVHRESNFWPRAVSPAGARGLGQLMPGTARDLGVKDTFAPEENLVGAATYLTDMLKQFGSPELALAAYNAGPGAVAKHGGIPPYRETRQYVADILHEVLREPLPTHGEKDLGDVARLGLAAFVADTSQSGIDESPFDKILTEKLQPESSFREQSPLAFAGKAEAAATIDNALARATGVQTDAMPEKVSKPGEQSWPMERAMNRPSPDLSSLPEPREFGGTLTQSQLVMRELAVDAALRHFKATGVKTTGLSEEAFVTLFVALIRRESSFNHRAVSPDGAKGLGQLMPDTVRAFGIEDPFAPQENLEVAATRLIKLLDQFGSPALALAAYNAGEKAITDRAVIPGARDTRQLVADVLYDLKNDPRPEFVVTRFQVAGRMDLALASRGPGDGLRSKHQAVSAPP